MKKLRKMKVINWHYFDEDEISFGSATMLSGHSGAGKSTLLDALQYLFIGSQTQTRFNAAATQEARRTLIHYLRGKIKAEGVQYLRADEFTSYIALEFYDDAKKNSGSIINVVEIQIVSSQHLFFCLKRGENMIKPTEFVNYVDRLPDDCVESVTDGEVHFHLPHPEHIICPFCRSSHIGVHQYRPQVLRGIPGATKRYVYNRRRYRCKDCGKTFAEESPFLASFQRRIGNRLRQIRAQKKITQGQVIEAVGIPLYLYKRYEDDTDAEVPPTLVAMQIANYLGADVLEIWGDQI